MIFAIASILIFVNCANAHEDNATVTLELDVESNVTDSLQVSDADDVLADKSSDLENRIVNAKNNEKITINPRTYKIHNIQITKNITLQGNGNPRDIIIDGEEKSSIFLISSPNVHVTFKNITFINGRTDNFGGAISINTGGATVDNCIFINNTALKKTNAGGISNYGTKDNLGYLLVNNSLFVNNYANHDGGAITTCYANSYIYNCVFINNSAHRDGGAIRVSVKGYGYVEDCIFMFNHADEWGGAYYSWSGTSDIRRCIFLNNTAGTNGGAVMVSGDINLQDSIIMNNNGGETGGSFYIQNPMYNAKTNMNIHNNLITNNSSPYGQEIFINWRDSYAYNLYTQFDNNDWGDEDPNDSSVIDPDNVTSRSKVSKTIKSNLFERLNVNLLNKYSDLLKDYFPNSSLEDLNSKFKTPENNNPNNNQNRQSNANNEKQERLTKEPIDKIIINSTDDEKLEVISNSSSSTPDSFSTGHSNVGNSMSSSPAGESHDNAYELNEKPSVSKEINTDLKYFAILSAITLILLAIGYKRNKKEE
jgi:predicted outer membrane repeat protein